LSLATLPCAALLATTPGVRRTRVTAAVLGVVSAALLVAPGGGRLDAVTRAFTVLLTVAFVAAVQLSPRPQAAFLRPALQAIWIAGVATAVLVQVMWGSDAWGALAWEARRSIGFTMRFFVKLQPAVIVLYEPIVRFVSLATPFTLALKAVAGLALAWRWHRWLTTAALSEPGNVPIHEALVTSTH
jgi:hypothetical protein